MTTPSQTVSMEQFVYELRMDLPRLYEEHPEGISVHVLHEEYGESIPRVLRAIQILADKEVLTIGQAASKVHFVLPKGATLRIAPPYAELTDLQRRLVLLLVESQANMQVQTNYTQLSRILQCSQGGVRNSLDRLEYLQYLRILKHSEPGRTNALLLQLNPDKVTIKSLST